MKNHGETSIDTIGRIMDRLGDQVFGEGVMPAPNLWTDDIQIVERDCPVCGALFVGLRTAVYAALAQHDFGHRHDEARQAMQEVMGGA